MKFFQNKGLGGIMLKNMLSMGAGLCGSAIGIQSRYYDKLAIFYTSQMYDEMKRFLPMHRHDNENEMDQNNVKHFAKVFIYHLHHSGDNKFVVYLAMNIALIFFCCCCF